MKKLSEIQLENLEGGKFWGWSEWECQDAGAGFCWCTRTHYVFWMVNTTEGNLTNC